MKKYITILISIFLFGSCKSSSDTTENEKSVTPDEARAIAKEAYIFAYPMLMSYQAQYFTLVNPNSPGYRGPVNEMSHDIRPADHTRKDVVTMNGDTPYSAFTLDLRTEPMVLSVPAIKDRYYVFQCVDLFTHNFAFIGTRATGTEAGDFLFVGPGYDGEFDRDKFKDVFYSESQLVIIIGRTQLKGKDDLPNVLEIQKQYDLQSLSEFEGKTRKTAPPIEWLPLQPEELSHVNFIKYFNFYLALVEPLHEDDVPALKRFEKIGVKPGADFDTTAIKPEVIAAINAGVGDAIKVIQAKAENIAERVNGWNMMEAFGPREFFKGDWLLRAAATMVGIYANDKIEAFYPIAYVDEDGEVLNASKHQYKIHFDKDQIPPAKYFWSATMYNKKADGVAGYLVENPINRYLINSTSEGLVYDEEGGFIIYVQHEKPTDEQLANWLPAPAEEFYLVLRIYGPEESVMNGSWSPPQIEKVN